MHLSSWVLPLPNTPPRNHHVCQSNWRAWSKQMMSALFCSLTAILVLPISVRNLRHGYEHVFLRSKMVKLGRDHISWVWILDFQIKTVTKRLVLKTSQTSHLQVLKVKSINLSPTLVVWNYFYKEQFDQRLTCIQIYFHILLFFCIYSPTNEVFHHWQQWERKMR